MNRAVSKMMCHTKVVAYYCSLLFLLTEYVSECNKQCANFEFYGLNDKVITATENTTVNIEFSLLYKTCSSLQTTIQISAWNDREGIYFPRCNIILTNEYCGGAVYPSMSCSCNITNRRYRFTKTVDRSDNKKWRWSTSDEKANETVFKFNVTYPARIIRLSVDGRDDPGAHFVAMNQSVFLTCTWENGNPPTTVRLIDSHGRLLVNSSDRSINHSYSAGHCELSGLIRCEAQHSFKTAEIYVQCPPTFKYTVADIHHAFYGQDAYLHFMFRANNLIATGCNLTHVETKCSYQCNFSPGVKGTFELDNHTTTKANLPCELEMKCSYIITGTAPSLTLTIGMHPVTEDSGGKWRVTLSNMQGTGTHEFTLTIILSPARVTSIALNGYKDPSVYLVSRNESVQIVCLWESGYPPATARLYNSHGNILQNKSDGNDIIYTLQFVNCSDTGVIRCTVDNSSKNTSAKLLVKCPPEMKSSAQENITASESSHTALTVQFRAHTAIITRCELAKYPEHNSYFQDKSAAHYYAIYICTLSKVNHTDITQHGPNSKKCKCSVKGAEPYLTLTISLYDVANKDNGKWRATLENEIGSDFVDFYLIVNKDSASQTWNTLTIIIVGLLVTLVGIAAILSGVYIRYRLTFPGPASCKLEIHSRETSSMVLQTAGHNPKAYENTLLDEQSIQLATTIHVQSTMTVSDHHVKTKTLTSSTVDSGKAAHLTRFLPSVFKVNTTVLEDSSEASNNPVALSDGYLTPRAETLTASEEIELHQISAVLSQDQNLALHVMETSNQSGSNFLSNAITETDFPLYRLQPTVETSLSKEYQETECEANSQYETIE